MKQMKAILVVVFVAFLFLSIPWEMEVRAADVLHMYTALEANEAKTYIEPFIKDTKINVEWVQMSAGEILTRLKAEAKNPQVSVWFGGPSVEFIAGKKEGLLTPYNSPVGAPFPERKLEGSRRLLVWFLLRGDWFRQQYKLF